ncbi:MAG: hypothetical protein ACYTGB_11055, partial [Planctomycetota bacterium]
MILLALGAAGAGWGTAGEGGAPGFGTGDFFWRLVLSRKGTGAPGAAGTLLEISPGRAGAERLVIRLGARSARVLSVRGDRETELASCVLEALPDEVSLVRRGRIHYILKGRALLMRAEFDGAHRGAPEVKAPDRTVAVRELLRQRLEPVLFVDRFARTAGRAGPWRVRRGPWESAVRSSGSHSANPGALRARFDPDLPADPMTEGRLGRTRAGFGVHLIPLEGGGL